MPTQEQQTNAPKRSPAQPVNKSEARLDRLEALLGKSIQAIGKQQQQIEVLFQASPVRKDSTQSHVPPSDDTEQKDARPPEHNPEEEQEDNHPSSDAATKPATSTTGTEGAFTKAEFEAALDAKLKEFAEKRVPELVKASTPRPYGYTEEMANISRDPVAFVRKAIAHDREVCGGPFTTSEGYFGFKSGRGDERARRSTATFLQKAFYGRETNQGAVN